MNLKKIIMEEKIHKSLIGSLNSKTDSRQGVFILLLNAAMNFAAQQ
jgi:hypothetical protein